MNDKVKILAFSSSREGDKGYLETAVPVIKTFLKDEPLKIAFIPFAYVGSYDDYLFKVQNALPDLPHTIILVTGNNKEVIQEADVIMVGGGNTFKLLHDLYELGLLDTIREKIYAGTPYIGWSAGSNILGLTIGTTNDMPIIEPLSFKALSIFPFQVNPHYYNEKPVGHNGESRDDRLKEFVLLNERTDVVCLPEGNGLLLQNKSLIVLGEKEVYTWRNESGQIIKEIIKPGLDIYYKSWKD